MNPLARDLKAIALQNARRQRVRTATILEVFGLEGVLADADANDYNRIQIVAHTLATCCVTDGKFNNCTIVLASVLQFIREQSRRELGEQAVRDLLAILDQGGQVAEIQKWAAIYCS